MEVKPNGLWLKVYTEVVHNPKLRLMPERYQLRYFWWLCLAKEGLDLESDNAIALFLHTTPRDVRATKAALQQAGLLGASGAVHDFDEAQDVGPSAKRMRRKRNRERQGGDTDNGSGGVTVPVTVTDIQKRREEKREEGGNNLEVVPPAALELSTPPPVRSRSRPERSRNRNGNRPMSRKQAAILERAASEHDLNLGKECDRHGIEYDPVLGPMSPEPQQLYDDILAAIHGRAAWPIGKAPRMPQDERSGGDGTATLADVVQSLQANAGGKS